MDSVLVERLSREMHPASHVDLMSDAAQGEVCPWTLMLTLALTVIKGESLSTFSTLSTLSTMSTLFNLLTLLLLIGLLPLAPKAVPLLVSDPEKRAKAMERISSAEFVDNFDDFFIKSIKKNFNAPLNAEILRSSQAVSLFSDVMHAMVNRFQDGASSSDDDHLLKAVEEHDHIEEQTPRSNFINVDNVARIVQVARTLWN